VRSSRANGVVLGREWFRNLATARIVVESLEGLRMKRREPSVDLVLIRREYHAAKKR
jgi:hypothetical protein